MNRNIDEMIRAYSDELMSFARSHNSESLVIKNKPEESVAVETEQKEEPTENAETISGKNEAAEGEAIYTEIPSEEDMKSYASFRGRVFTGFGAFPVENAKVVLYKDGVIYAFLVTDKSGETPTVKIESFPERNSLEPLSDEQRTDYSADVYAEGFNEKKNLLVSAVGGSDVVLDVELTPESEVIG